MPFYPDSDMSEEGQPYDVIFFWEKLVADYMGISIPDVQDMDMVDYLAIRRDAFISGMSKSEKGRKYLQEAWFYEQTDADYDGIRQIQKEMTEGRCACGR